MTKCDYVKFAAMIKEYREELSKNYASLSHDTLEIVAIENVEIVKRMARIFHEDNPLFDYGQFYKACGMDWLNS